MATIVKLTANFERNLEAIEGFLAEVGAPNGHGKCAAHDNETSHARLAVPRNSPQAARFPHPNPAPRPTAGFAQPADSGGGKHASRNPAIVPVGEGARIPSPQSSPASGRGGKREEQLSISESLREFHVKAYDRLLDDLSNTLIPNLEYFPAMGRSFLGRPVCSVEVANALARLQPKLHDGALREYLFGDYLVLYAQFVDVIHLLSIKHHRQLSFDFQSLWSGKKAP